MGAFDLASKIAHLEGEQEKGDETQDQRDKFWLDYR